jgi:hypothetical protein
MTTGTATKINPVTQAAREALLAADNDVLKATEALRQRVKGNPALFRQLMEPLVHDACYDAVRAQCRVQRSAIWSPPVHRADSADRVKALAQSNLMSFPLPGGLRLGDATREDVVKAREFYASQADSMAHKARWLELVAQSLTGRKTVAKALTETRLQELKEAAAS